MINASELRLQVNNGIASALVGKLGYKWPDERISRIATDAAEAIAEGIPASWAFAQAFDDELVMYGDGGIDSVMGILNT